MIKYNENLIKITIACLPFLFPHTAAKWLNTTKLLSSSSRTTHRWISLITSHLVLNLIDNLNTKRMWHIFILSTKTLYLYMYAYMAIYCVLIYNEIIMLPLTIETVHFAKRIVLKLSHWINLHHRWRKRKFNIFIFHSKFE